MDELAHRVIGAAIEVHRHLGPGFLEGVYEDALAVEFRLRGIPIERQKLIAVGYKGDPVGEGRLDFLVGRPPDRGVEGRRGLRRRSTRPRSSRT